MLSLSLLFFSPSRSTRSSDFAAFTRRKSFTPRDLRLRFLYPASRCLGLLHQPSINATIEGFTLLELDLPQPRAMHLLCWHSYQPSTGIAQNDLAKRQVKVLINARSTRTTGSTIPRWMLRFDASDWKRQLNNLLYIRLAFYRWNFSWHFILKRLRTCAPPLCSFEKFMLRNVPSANLLCKIPLMHLECNKMYSYLPKNISYTNLSISYSFRIGDVFLHPYIYIFINIFNKFCNQLFYHCISILSQWCNLQRRF